MAKRDARSLDHKTLEEMRRLGVQRVVRGESQRAVAASIGVHWQTVNKWMRAYRDEGSQALASTKASGRPPALNAKQSAKLRRVIVGKNPAQLNFGPALWTLRLVGQLIDELFDVTLHASTIARLLHRLGITPQKPTRQAFQRDDAEVAHWLTSAFPAIVEEAQRKQATIMFLDETQLREDSTVGRTWGARGETPVVKTNGTRRRINVISAISPRGQLWFRCFQGGLNAERFEGFLRDLIGRRTKPLVIVTDRHPAHTSARIQRFLKTHEGRIQMHFLPSYAPDLNPDEHVWSALKGMYRQDPLGPEEKIERSVERAMNKIKSDRNWVRSFFGHPSVQYVKQALSWK